MNTSSLSDMRSALSAQHSVIHAAFQGLPSDAYTTHPVLYHAVSAAASAQSAALDALQVLDAVLREDDKL